MHEQRVLVLRRSTTGASDNQAATGVAFGGVASGVGGERLARAAEIRVWVRAGDGFIAGGRGDYFAGVVANVCARDRGISPLYAESIGAGSTGAVGVYWENFSCGRGACVCDFFVEAAAAAGGCGGIWRSGALVMALTVLVVPMSAPYNQVLLVPVVLELVRGREKFLARSRNRRLAYLVGALLVGWQWIASLSLSAAYLAGARAWALAHWTYPFFATFALPVWMFALIFFCVLDERSRVVAGPFQKDG